MQYSKEFLLEIHRNLLETRLLEEIGRAHV